VNIILFLFCLFSLNNPETASEGLVSASAGLGMGKVGCVLRANNGEYWRFLKRFSMLKREIT